MIDEGRSRVNRELQGGGAGPDRVDPTGVAVCSPSARGLDLAPPMSIALGAAAQPLIGPALKIRPAWFGLLTAASDAGCCLLAWFIADLIHVCGSGGCWLGWPHGQQAAVAAMATVMVSASARAYRAEALGLTLLRAPTLTTVFGFAPLVGLCAAWLVAPQAAFTWPWILTMLAIVITLTACARSGLRQGFRLVPDHWIAPRSVALVGAAADLAVAARDLAAAVPRWNRLVSLTLEPGDGTQPEDRRRVVERIERLVVEDDLKEVIVVVPANAACWVYQLLLDLEGAAIRIRVARGGVQALGCLPRAEQPGAWRFTDVTRWRVEDPELAAKRALDIVLSLLLLLACLPLLLLIAFLIKLDNPGPALFRQVRVGYQGRPFLIHKFRTMRQLEGHVAGGRQATRNDPRVTRVGRWLRRTSLDELPQLLDVLRGKMSLVGPRPHALHHDQAFAAEISGYTSRRKVRPGITGWAQVNGFRGEISDAGAIAARLNYDLAYADHWSLWLDLEILVRTVRVVIGGQNAY